jgi:hypothetical protein
MSEGVPLVRRHLGERMGDRNGAGSVLRTCAVDVLGARAQRFDARLQRNHRPAGGLRRTYCFSVGIGVSIPLAQ